MTKIEITKNYPHTISFRIVEVAWCNFHLLQDFQLRYYSDLLRHSEVERCTDLDVLRKAKEFEFDALKEFLSARYLLGEQCQVYYRND